MKTKLIVALVPACLALSSPARSFTLTADQIAADRQTESAVATGHVVAVSMPLQLRSESASRDASGVVRLADPTLMTTCTNEPGVCHWALKGAVEYQDERYILGRNMWLEFCERPIFWIPYFYRPLDSDYGIRVMPGYTSRWGAYLLTKYVYHLAGDPAHGEETLWLSGSTRFDIREVNGLAGGETLRWGLGGFGKGLLKFYYAHDRDNDHYMHHWGDPHDWNYRNWGSDIPRDRYIVELGHRWEPTERDVVRVKGSVLSDSYVRHDFVRETYLTMHENWLGHNGNELAWEHQESTVATGVSVSGPLNDFIGGTSRLPEWYCDVAPMPVTDLINYESQTRAGYLVRRYAIYGDDDRSNVFSHRPGLWAHYNTFRADTYHRLTAPMKFADRLSVVPRVAYRGTFWNDCGDTLSDGRGTAGSDNGTAFRSIFESGVTFAGRGKGWINNRWQQIVEPYTDVLAQEAWYAGMDGEKRPYVFDSLDASVDWEDQFAGRARNLPYSYYGVTPGVRNAYARADEKGNVSTLIDFDAYAAVQIRRAEWTRGGSEHKLADIGSPNYGKDDIYVSPGARVRWHPDDDILLGLRAEYDPDRNRIALADAEWRQRTSDSFSYFARLTVRDYRLWDFASTPYDAASMSEDCLNRADARCVTLGFVNQPIDWFAWSPFARWDCSENELDTVGSWFDYLTDCLGFRLIVEYKNDYTRVDGSEYDSDWNVGFFIYLRAFGVGSPDTHMR